MAGDRKKNKADRNGWENSLLGRLEQYGRSDFYPFHMPGHKRREPADGYPGGFPNPYGIDITEIDGFDDLHHAEGILKESMERAAEIYGADQTFYLVNGSTCGILGALFGCASQNGKILMARNSHKAAYHGAELRGLKIEYLYPEFLTEYGIHGGIRPEAVERALFDNRSAGEKERIQAVFLTSPTYEGIVSDIEAIAAIAHRAGIPLIVDEAHGAHFSFGEGEFPVSALRKGADVVIQSLHKTLPSFTQTAVLHVKGNLADKNRIGRYLSVFQSSSPSYLFMAGIERCIQYMDHQGREEMRAYGKRMERFFKELQPLKALKVPGREICGQNGVYDLDRSKVTISVKGVPGIDGPALSRILREQYHLEMEMAAPEHVIAMTSLMDTKEGLERLKTALLEIDEELWSRRDWSKEEAKERREAKESRETKESWEPADGKFLWEETETAAMTIQEAVSGPVERISFLEAAGRVSAEFVYLYPPGIPILVPGERITGKIVERVREYQEKGLSVQGLSDSSLTSILAVAKAAPV